MGKLLAQFAEERIAKYRLLAQEARNAALNAEAREAIEMHMAMAEVWEHIALELQHFQEMPHSDEPKQPEQALDADPLSRTMLPRGK